ncbi:MAG: hypothetical protein KJ000_16305 [Pirellulaceae bacterium]|nr:hypothetical protein [Pirellulaceae bacterium]
MVCSLDRRFGWSWMLIALAATVGCCGGKIRQLLPLQFADSEKSGLTASVKDGQNQILLALDE